MRVLHYFPFGYPFPIASGADRVACNQLDYFQHRGWKVSCAVADLGMKSEAAFRHRYSCLESITLLPVPWFQRNNFGEQTVLYDRVRSHPTVREFFARQAELFFTNYVFTAPLALEAPQGCRRVLETHDLMSTSFTNQERVAAGAERSFGAWELRRRFLYDVESDLYQLFDRVIMLSPSEHAAVLPRHRGRAVFVPQSVPAPERVSATACEHDLLFVGSGHAPNRLGIEWFYRHVYLPYLRAQGTRLTIVGSVCGVVRFGGDSRVKLIPRVEGSLDATYAASKVVIVPLFEGTGISVKLIEALGAGCAVVTTPIGARGMEDAGGAFVTSEMRQSPAVAAGIIRDLLQNSQARSALQTAGRAYFQARHHQSAYFAALDRALQSDLVAAA